MLFGLQLLLLHLTAQNALAVPCVFLHGAGETSTTPPTATFSEYWGSDIEKHTPQCTSRSFNHDDTVNTAWDDAAIQERYCAVAANSTQISKEGNITNTIVFTHSMGNLILAGALAHNRCRLDRRSSTWVSLNAPWDGSQAADYQRALCTKNQSLWTEWEKWLAEELHYCVQDPATKAWAVSAGYRSLDTTNPENPAARAVAEQFVGRALCGTSPFGLTSEFSLPLEPLSAAVGFGEADDGMVGIGSCLLAGRTYEEDYAAPFYRAEVNHADGTCMEGDGDFGEAARQPCKFLAAATLPTATP